MSELLNAALEYAELGWPVFPCLPGTKVPATSSGVKDATTNTRQIRAWWHIWPTANIALACGDIVAIDVDVDEAKGINGMASLACMQAIPKTVWQRTPRGGAHYLFRTDYPPANRNGFRAGIDIRSNGYYIILAPSRLAKTEKYCGGVYEWNPGCSPWDLPLAELPDFLRPEPKQSRASVPALVPAPFEPDDEILRRAAAYLATCEPAVQGCRGHEKLLWAASCMVHGFRLSDEQAFDLLSREYNPLCDPPWDLSESKDLKDFRRKITEARKLPPRHGVGWLLDEDDERDAIVQSFIERIKCGEVTKDEIAAAEARAFEAPAPIPLGSQISKSDLDFLTHPSGLLGDICAWLNATATRLQPILSLGCALAFLGALFGHKVRSETGARTNLYCMGIAPSSAGKAHAMSSIRRLAAEAGCIDLIGGSRFSSDSAIEARLSEHPVTLYMLDEIGHFFLSLKKSQSSHEARIVSTLMQVYSAAGDVYTGCDYADPEKHRVIVQPCCCLYGTSTPQKFLESLSSDEISDGWLSRCLCFFSDEIPDKRRGVISPDIPEHVIEQVRAWVQRDQHGAPIVADQETKRLCDVLAKHGGRPAPSPLVIPATDSANRIFEAFDNESTKLARSDDTAIASLWLKGEENARKIALVVAAGNSFDRPVVNEEVADYACRLMRYILQSMTGAAPEIVDSKHETVKRKLFKIIESTGTRGCPKAVITKKTQWIDGKRERDKYLEDLIEACLIVSARDNAASKGRPTTTYWTAGNYAKYLEANK